MSVLSKTRIFALVLIFSSAHADMNAAVGNFHELNRYTLGGDGSWDYLTVDAEARRIYIARGNRVMVVDADSGKSVGEVKGLDGAHGIALVKESNLGFATSGKSGEVFVFDLKTLSVLNKIKAGENPDAIVYNAASKRILAFNGKSHNVTVIDATTQKVVGTIAVSGKPEFSASDDSSRVFVNIEDKNQLVEIDPAQSKVLATYPLEPCDEPTGMSIDLRSKRLIVGCGNKLAVIVDANSGKMTQKFAAGDGVDATAFDSEHHLAFVSAGEGVLTVLSEDSTGFQHLQDVSTVKGARTLAVDEKTGRVFLPIARFKPSTSHSNGVHARPTVVDGTFALLVVGKN